MSWARLDDRWRGHEKHLRAQHLAGSKLVKWLWVEALSECCDNRTDGVIAAYRFDPVYEGTGLPRSKREPFRAALVTSGLWHDHETVSRCSPCRDAIKDAGRALDPGDLRVHDFEDFQSTKDQQTSPVKKLKGNQRRALLRDVPLLERIFERDRGLCRYCGIRCTQIPNDNRSRSRLQHDHIDPACFDPNMGNTLDNVVLACAGCNRDKGERTPAEAGMALLPPGTTAHDLAVGPAPTDTEPRTDRTDRTDRVEGDGSGRDRIGTGSDRAGSGRSGSGHRRSRGRSGAPPPPEARPP